jgi:hypothetical protein
MIGSRLHHLTICVAVILLPSVAFAEANSVAGIDNALQIDEIVQHYQAQCDEEQASVLPDIDAEELDKPEKGVLTLAPDNIYDIQITPSGKHATVLVPEFHCSNIGHAWCGSGGCGFYLVVDGKTYYHVGGFGPTSVTFQYGIGPQTVILFTTHGTGCKNAEGNTGVGSDPCYSSVVWSEERDTFFSLGGGTRIWGDDWGSRSASLH